jgi:hypothetical protein
VKSIEQIYGEGLAALPVGSNGKPDPQDTARLKWEAYGRFWGPVRAILDPRDTRVELGGPAEHFFDRGEWAQSAGEMVEGIKSMKQLLRVERLSFGTYFKGRQILVDALQKAKTWHDVDVALCAVMVFLQLELGGQPDPEYGQFPEPANPWRELRDENLSDDPTEAEAQLDTSESFGSAELRLLRYFQKCEETINEAEKFERAFPGMGHRRAHVVQALHPLFDHLDPFYKGHTLEMCFEWVSRLLKSPLEEQRLPSGQEEPREYSPPKASTAEKAVELA